MPSAKLARSLNQAPSRRIRLEFIAAGANPMRSMAASRVAYDVATTRRIAPTSATAMQAPTTLRVPKRSAAAPSGMPMTAASAMGMRIRFESSTALSEY